MATYLDGSELDSEVREAVACHVVRTALTCVYALRAAHYALWRDTAAGSLLLQIDPTLPDTPRNDTGETGSDGGDPQPAG